MYELVNAKNKIRDLSEEEYIEIKMARNYILFYLQFEELNEIVKANYSEFWRYVFEICENFRLHFVTDYSELITPVVFSNQKLLNILNSFKTYVDHFLHSISKFHTNSVLLESCKKIFQDIYDSNFTYRFMTRLRNYVQHFRLPIVQINYNSKLINEKLHEWIQLVSLNVKKEDLLEFNGWSKVQKEIRKLDDYFDIKPYIFEYYNILNYIHFSIRNFLSEGFEDSKSTLNKLISIELNEDDKNKFSNLFNPSMFIYKIEDGKEIEEMYLPYKSLQRIEELRKRNQCLQKKGISYSIIK